VEEIHLNDGLLKPDQVCLAINSQCSSDHSRRS
jgi:hypothetical protein